MKTIQPWPQADRQIGGGEKEEWTDVKMTYSTQGELIFIFGAKLFTNISIRWDATLFIKENVEFSGRSPEMLMKFKVKIYV